MQLLWPWDGAVATQSNSPRFTLQSCASYGKNPSLLGTLSQVTVYHSSICSHSQSCLRATIGVSNSEGGRDQLVPQYSHVGQTQQESLQSLTIFLFTFNCTSHEGVPWNNRFNFSHQKISYSISGGRENRKRKQNEHLFLFTFIYINSLPCKPKAEIVSVHSNQGKKSFRSSRTLFPGRNSGSCNHWFTRSYCGTSLSNPLAGPIGSVFKS